jgi:anthranilate synthase component 1/para-aminobenzoate synthetase component 1
MYYPSKAEVGQLSNFKKDCLIPLKKEIKFNAKPQEAHRRLQSIQPRRLGPQKGMSFLLESCRNYPKTGRFSFVGADPFLIFKSKDNNTQIIKNCRGTLPALDNCLGRPGQRAPAIRSNPINTLRSLLNEYKSIKIPGIDGFTGGAVGYFSYECRHLFEKLSKLAKDDLLLPDMYFMFVDTLCVFDHIENKLSIISNIYPDKPLGQAYDEAVERIERLESSLRALTESGRSNLRAEIASSPAAEGGKAPRNDVRSTFTKVGFEDAVRRAKEYITAGDIYQANLSQRFCVDIRAIDPLILYEQLSNINPSPFACYLDFSELKIVSSSPERLVKLENGIVQTRPIAGTRPRGKTPYEDLALSCELILSDKERAEHIMLVDLERNDLGKICEYGSVRADELMEIEDYSCVIHIVSNITGKLRSGRDRFDLLCAAFPGGTITGCPKIRCMDIIDELEPVTRNIYTGSIGYLDFNGDMDLNIAIRTFVIKPDRAYLQVGAGIVADSDPEREYYETLYKAEALFKALEKINEKTFYKCNTV